MTRSEKKMKSVAAAVTVMILSISGTSHAGWRLPMSVTGGGITAKAGIGMERSGSEGYDPGKDVPVLEAGTITAYFAHPEWGVTQGGSSFSSFYEEIKGENYPAEWQMDVSTGVSGAHTLNWTLPESLPKGFRLKLLPPSGGEIDMLAAKSYSFTPGVLKRFTIQADLVGIEAPMAPEITSMTPGNNALFVTWERNDPDAAGYRIHFGKESGNYDRTIDVRQATNLKIRKLTNGEPCYVAVSSYNKAGVESGRSGEVIGIPENNRPGSPTSGFTKVASGESVLLTVGGSRDGDDEALTYEVEVYGDRNLTQLILSATNLPEEDGNAVLALGNLSDGVYYWRSRANDGTESGKWSATRAIRVGESSTSAEQRIDKAYGKREY